MISSELIDSHRQYSDPPEPEVSTHATPLYLKALRVLAVLVLVGLGVSFWPISEVTTPKFDLHPTPSADGAGTR